MRQHMTSTPYFLANAIANYIPVLFFLVYLYGSFLNERELVMMCRALFFFKNCQIYKDQDGPIFCAEFSFETKLHGRYKMTFQRSVFLLRWALNLAFALVAFRGKTCDGLDFLCLFHCVQVENMSARDPETSLAFVK